MNQQTKDYVAEKVKSGQFPSEEAVYDAAIEALRREEKAKLDALRHEIELGLEDARAGRFSTRSVMDIAEDTKRDMLSK